ncbi:MAG TPA: outer membrane beta-barrel protein [bacterium]|nr:outer membrane beta-barrel protein [bacterium]HPG44904.1 outer membrane beta-barrel protein [bacterium]HPM98067.1 outer membrane beta-barrel protein [bacterium]
MSTSCRFRGLTVVCLSLFSCLLVNATCFAQGLELFLIGQQMKGDQTTGLGQQLDIGEHSAGGFGMGIDMGKFNLNMDLLFGSTNIKVDITEMDSKLFFFDANLDYAFLNRAITPLVTVGIGSVNFSDSFVKIENVNETDFSSNIGVGLRAAISDRLFFKGLYRTVWTKIKETDKSIGFSGISLSLGYRFVFKY